MKRPLLFLLLCCTFSVFAAEKPEKPKEEKTLEDTHGTMRAWVEGGYQENLGPAIGVGYRFGLHDLLDLQGVFPDFTQIDILNLRLQYYPQVRSLHLDDLTIFRVQRLPPITQKWEELSFKFEVGARTLREGTCNYCGAGTVLGGLGGTVEPFGTPVINISLLAEAEIVISPKFAGFFIKPSVGPRLTVRFRVKPWLNGWVYGLYRYQVAVDDEILEAGTQWRLALSKSWALNARLSRLGDGWEGAFGALAYF